ncbi:Gfo/Idh/MocA family oxidoreductase [Oscillospiraceae bacterium HV4-5-C5C]|nr:Gfo/Idh/MocA family oxidoreductase [Oscillospiraceae bacterium HV4-5-C5C]
MSDKIYKVGIIGCGGIANGKHLPALHKLKNVEICHFCDLIPERAEKAAAEYGVPDAKVTTDYKAVVNDPTLDVIHVCTPNREHSFMTIEALEAGKHVMCEKPMAKTYEEAKAMVETARRTGKKLTIGYQSRHRADAQYLKQVVDHDELGEIYFAKAQAIRRRGVPTWGVFLNEEEQGGGPLIDIGTHALDLTLWEMNNYDVDYVVGNTYRKLADTKNAANIFGSWDPEKFTVEDAAFGFITMKNGATIILGASWALNYVDQKEAATILCGTKGGADMTDGLRINGEKFSRLYDYKPDLNVGGVAFYSGSAEEPHEREARLFYEAIDQDKAPLVLPEQALVVTRVLEAIYTSSKTRKPVYFN